jgi:hypothetical protein
MVKRNDIFTRASGITRGEPDAVRVARPVRRAGRGNPPVERLAGRPGPTRTPSWPAPTSGPGSSSLAGVPGGQAEPEGSLLPGRLGHETDGHHGDGRDPGHPLGPPPEPMGHEVSLHRRGGDGLTEITQAVGVLATPDGRLDHGQGEEVGHHVGGGGVGQLGRQSGLGHQGLEAVTLSQRLPLVEAGAGHSQRPTGLGHIAGFSGQIKQTDASLIDDLCWVTVMGSLILW